MALSIITRRVRPNRSRAATRTETGHEVRSPLAPVWPATAGPASDLRPRTRLLVLPTVAVGTRSCADGPMRLDRFDVVSTGSPAATGTTCDPAGGVLSLPTVSVAGAASHSNARGGLIDLEVLGVGARPSTSTRPGSTSAWSRTTRTSPPAATPSARISSRTPAGIPAPTAQHWTRLPAPPARAARPSACRPASNGLISSPPGRAGGRCAQPRGWRLHRGGLPPRLGPAEPEPVPQGPGAGRSGGAQPPKGVRRARPHSPRSASRSCATSHCVVAWRA